MAIDTVNMYYPHMKLPVWVKITPVGRNTYEVGKKYDIRIEDSERQEEKGGEGPYNYVHEALLIGKWTLRLRNVPDILLGFSTDSKERHEAISRVAEGEKPERLDREVEVLSFLRLDMAKDFVEEGGDAIPGGFSKEDAEGNGPTTG